jgi:hypothetical protein
MRHEKHWRRARRVQFKESLAQNQNFGETREAQGEVAAA